MIYAYICIFIGISKEDKTSLKYSYSFHLKHCSSHSCDIVTRGQYSDMLNYRGGLLSLQYNNVNSIRMKCVYLYIVSMVVRIYYHFLFIKVSCIAGLNTSVRVLKEDNHP